MSAFMLDQILSAKYVTNEVIVFSVSGSVNGESFENIDHYYNPRSRSITDLLCKAWLEENSPTPYEKTAQDRRNERTKIFAETIDRMNAVWYGSLTDTQKANLETWRQAWLNYPETDVVPEASLVTDIFGIY